MERPVTNAVRNTVITSFLLTCVAAVGFAQAASPGEPLVHGAGLNSCSQYLSAVSDRAPGIGMKVKRADVDYFDAAHVHSEWLAGFMSAMNMWSAPTMQITADAAAIDVWVRKWCEQHPTQVLVRAAAAFVREQFLTQLSNQP
jgi:hypothetical protein